MNWWEAVVLGLVQGLTEFLPISSSGHLVLTQEVLGVSEPGAALEIAVHLGTLFSVLLYYRRDVAEVLRDVVTGGPEARTGWMVVLATLPTVAFALLAKDALNAAFDDPYVAAVCLGVTGLFLLSTRLAKRRPDAQPGFAYALLIGVAQMIAVTPGISRSGSTIGAAMFWGDDPIRAARFSFLMSIPAISGAAILHLMEPGEPNGTSVAMLVLAAVVAFLSGWAAIALLIRLLGRGGLAWFGPYCLAAGVAGWFLLG